MTEGYKIEEVTYVEGGKNITLQDIRIKDIDRFVQGMQEEKNENFFKTNNISAITIDISETSSLEDLNKVLSAVPLEQKKQIHQININGNIFSEVIELGFIKEFIDAKEENLLTIYPAGMEGRLTPEQEEKIKEILMKHEKAFPDSQVKTQFYIKEEDKVIDLDSDKLPIKPEKHIGNPEVTIKVKIKDTKDQAIDLSDKLDGVKKDGKVKITHTDNGMSIMGKTDDVNEFYKNVKLKDLPNESKIEVKSYAKNGDILGSGTGIKRNDKWFADGGLDKAPEKTDDPKEKINEKNSQKEFKDSKFISGHYPYLATNNHNLNYNNQHALNGRSTHSDGNYMEFGMNKETALGAIGLGIIVYFLAKCYKIARNTYNHIYSQDSDARTNSYNQSSSNRIEMTGGTGQAIQTSTNVLSQNKIQDIEDINAQQKNKEHSPQA